MKPSDSDWVVDTSASHHIINDIQNLSICTPYDGMDELQLTDGLGLKITHTGYK